MAEEMQGQIGAMQAMLEQKMPEEQLAQGLWAELEELGGEPA